jgi:hypothetical protein
MRNMLALLAAALLVFAGVGWYLGWYKISSTSDESGHRKINIDLDKNKIADDLNKGRQKLHDLLANKEKEGQQPVTTATSPPPAPFRTTSDGVLILPPVDAKQPVVPVDYTPRAVPPE